MQNVAKQNTTQKNMAHQNIAQKTQTPLIDYLLRLGDSALVLGQRHAQLCGKAFLPCGRCWRGAVGLAHRVLPCYCEVFEASLA